MKIFGIDNQRTRIGDIEITDQKAIEWRYKMANENGSKVMVSIHLDSGDKSGLFSIYRNEEGKKLATSIADNMSTLPLHENAVHEDVRGLGILKGFKGDAAIIIELGGIGDNLTKDAIKENASLIGKEIATGIYSYLNKGEKPNEKITKKIEFIRDWFAH